jgi:hypothetical protein
MDTLNNKYAYCYYFKKILRVVCVVKTKVILVSKFVNNR